MDGTHDGFMVGIGVGISSKNDGVAVGEHVGAKDGFVDGMGVGTLCKYVGI